MIDPETKDAVKIAAAKTLGTVTEVAAFTERKETRVITSSEDAKTKLLAKLREMMKANATDATVIDADTTKEKAIECAKTFRVELAPVYWDGEAGDFKPLTN